jgi:hypothetical protein
MPRFDAERIAVTRPVLALAGIVATVAISFGIKDYVQQKQANPPVSTGTLTVENPKAKISQKKSTSIKTRDARSSATETKALASGQTSAYNTEQALIRKESIQGGAKAMDVNNAAANSVITQGTADDEEVARCVPLPNGTKPGDVDALYYKNWARTYGCVFPP